MTMKPALAVRAAREAMRLQSLYGRRETVPPFVAIHCGRLLSIAENNGVVLQ